MLDFWFAIVAVMESLNTPHDAYVPSYLRDHEEWAKILEKPYYRALLEDLIGWTQANADADEHEWVTDRDEVARRWVYLSENLASSAGSHSHPIYRRGSWGYDKEWEDDAMAAIDMPDEPFESRGEAGLVLARSLVFNSGVGDNGLSVAFYHSNTHPDRTEPDIVAAFTTTYDLRDMSAPTVSVLGDMTADDYALLDEASMESLGRRLEEAADEITNFGINYSWINDMTPQQRILWDESFKLREFHDLYVYGTTKNDEIWQIRHERKAEEIAKLREERPDFGKVPDEFEALPGKVRESIVGMFMYFDQMRDPFEDISIDTHTLGHMEMSEKRLRKLIDAGVLENPQTAVSLGGPLIRFDLCKPYYEAWVSRHYLPETDDEDVSED